MNGGPRRRTGQYSARRAVPVKEESIHALAERSFDACAAVRRAVDEWASAQYELSEAYEATLKGRRSA